MDTIRVYLELGKKKTFAATIDWPGWCRSGRDEALALQALFDYGERYLQVLKRAGLDLRLPRSVADFVVVERLPGTATTDFGAPATIPAVDLEPLVPPEFNRFRAVLQACWQVVDAAMAQAAGHTLKTGPRGGGRTAEKILMHLMEADGNYLRRLAWKFNPNADGLPANELARLRQAVQDALQTAVTNGLPEKGPRGGAIWPVRYAIRRMAWHALDHAWEIEDRIEG